MLSTGLREKMESGFGCMIGQSRFMKEMVLCMPMASYLTSQREKKLRKISKPRQGY